MGMRINAELPLPADLKAEYPLSDKIIKIKEKEMLRFEIYLQASPINLL